MSKLQNMFLALDTSGRLLKLAPRVSAFGKGLVCILLCASSHCVMDPGQRCTLTPGIT